MSWSLSRCLVTTFPTSPMETIATDSQTTQPFISPLSLALHVDAPITGTRRRCLCPRPVHSPAGSLAPKTLVPQHKAPLSLHPATPGPAQGQRLRRSTQGQWGWRKRSGEHPVDGPTDILTQQALEEKLGARRLGRGGGPGSLTHLSVSPVRRSSSSHRTLALSVPFSPECPCHNLIISAKNLFPNKSHSEVLSEHEFGGAALSSLLWIYKLRDLSKGSHFAHHSVPHPSA